MTERRLPIGLAARYRPTEENTYTCKFEWPPDCHVQCGDSGIVFSKTGNYRTAFFEAFPRDPDTFIRGEGATVEEAETKTWEEYQSYQGCSHGVFERRSHISGAGYCITCGMFKSDALAPLTSCAHCEIPTYWAKDWSPDGESHIFYCEEHAHMSKCGEYFRMQQRAIDANEEFTEHPEYEQLRDYYLYGPKGKPDEH